MSTSEKHARNPIGDVAAKARLEADRTRTNPELLDRITLLEQANAALSEVSAMMAAEVIRRAEKDRKAICELEQANAALVATLAERDEHLFGCSVIEKTLHRQVKHHSERARSMHRRAQRAEGVVSSLTDANRLTFHIRKDRKFWADLADIAMREGLKECERLRGSLDMLREFSKGLSASLDNAFRMLATAEMREEAAKKRVCVLTEALEKLEFSDDHGECFVCNGNNDSCWEPSPHDPGCIVGIALGRIPAEVPYE